MFTGYTDELFFPDEAVSVGEAVTVLMRLCGYDDKLTGDCTGFPHEPYMREDGAWPYNYLYFANTHFEIWLALNSFGSDELPAMPCTREECLKLIAQCLLDHPIPSHDGKTARQLLGWEYPEPENRDFIVENGVLVAYTGPSYVNLVIPDNLGITAIGSGFLDPSDQQIYSVVIPEGVVTVGDHAFYLQAALHSVVLPSTLTEMQASAFQDCIRLSDVTFPDRSTKIDPFAFANSIWEHREAARAMGLGYQSPEYAHVE